MPYKNDNTHLNKKEFNYLIIYTALLRLVFNDFKCSNIFLFVDDFQEIESRKQFCY